ncbi:PIF1-like helicase [Aureococcus anophagefferens]|nr:PIF1-like helicase [Aureococcus anophagefferens]
MGKRKRYVVTRGRQTGIFDTWEDCERQVKGFSGAQYKSYATQEDAENAFAAAAPAPSATAGPASVPLAGWKPPARPARSALRAVSRRAPGRDRAAAEPSFEERWLEDVDAAPPPPPPPPRGGVAPPRAGADRRRRARASAFLTGNAGTGKTTTMHRLILELRRRQRGEGRVFVTASTGAAAVLVGGTTLHSFAGVGRGDGSAEQLAAKLSKPARKRWRQCASLVIDEISMIDGALLDKIDAVARAARGNARPFGGVQVLACGDFAQLPPVRVTRFAFEAESWRGAFGARQYCLSAVFRQRDAGFVSLLNELRVGRASPKTVRTLEATASNELKDGDIEPTKLYATNAQVDRLNASRLDALTGAPETLRARDSGQADRFVQCQWPEELVLKPRAQIMLLHNTDVVSGLCNGSRGVVVGFERDAKSKRVTGVRCRFARGGVHVVERESTSVYEGDAQIASRSQFPLKLAWAVTIHKSQGQSIDLLEVDLRGCFEYGQAYTAVSRATSMDRLRVVNFDASGVKAHPTVLNFHAALTGDLTAVAAPEPEPEDDVVDLTDSAKPASGGGAFVDLTDSAKPASGGSAFVDLTADAPAAAKAPTAHWDFASGKRRPPPKQATSLPTGAADCLAGRVFVTTGVLPSLDRDQVAQIVKACGGRVTSAVSGKTTHLIAGDVLDDGRPTHTSSKYVKAQNLNVAIIDEAAFRAMLG